jgi:hypothetical protein
MGPHQWYDLINAHVFFWLDSSRLNRQRAACGTRPQVVAVVRTADLLARHVEIAYVTPFNVGYALRKPARRSEATLVPYNTWVTSGWATEAEVTGSMRGPSSHPPAELLIRGPIPHFGRLVQYWSSSHRKPRSRPMHMTEEERWNSLTSSTNSCLSVASFFPSGPHS